MRLKPATEFRDAALVEPLACVVQGVEDTKLRAGQRVLIIGTGPIGLMFVALARHLGCMVTVAGRGELRLRTATKLGAERVIDLTGKKDMVRAIQGQAKAAFDVVIEAVGKSGGLGGGGEAGAQGRHGEFLRRLRERHDGVAGHGVDPLFQPEIAGEFSSHAATVRRALELIEAGVIRADDFVNGECPLSGLPELFKCNGLGQSRRENAMVQVRLSASE